MPVFTELLDYLHQNPHDNFIFDSQFDFRLQSGRLKHFFTVLWKE